MPRPPTSTLFPYTTLFRSELADTLTERPAELRQLPGPEDDQSNHQNDDQLGHADGTQDRKSTRLNSSHSQISYAVFCLKKKKQQEEISPVVTLTPLGTAPT